MSAHDPATTSNQPAELTYRSLPILIGYLVLCAGLALNACRVIYSRYQERQKSNDWGSPHRRGHFFVFAVLAPLCLGVTWFHMIAFFVHSYRNWEQTRYLVEYTGVELPSLVKLELWLQKTKLFEEAWATVVETSPRLWWSGQIFWWCTGWSVLLGVLARRYRIPHIWTYMLLGQLVAISFAAILVFATVLVSQPSWSKQSKGKKSNEDDGQALFAWCPPVYAEVLPVAISLLGAVFVPSVVHSKHFMPILLIPHLLLFIPATLHPSRSSGNTKPQVQGQVEADRTTRRYIVFFQWIIAACIVLHAQWTYVMLQDSGAGFQAISYISVARDLPGVIYEHPAQSSVSWDVIFCTITSLAWTLVHGGSPSRMLGGQ
ncbi:hypothetical protein N7462_010748 [Penicillium macrosclerotiorum]|uniref:uncharacterized protein n=1 Tax=Penicillium macrosclerotiorum TaxID=303699 RepID=UPI002549A766|nr:uncharacterized protein N7462_010748 [Penicillium macrosclerotiorum]KAJ5669678.1 hypothetical protein N7462_010748 [Penicillium macrosclerotiorum]